MRWFQRKPKPDMVPSPRTVADCWVDGFPLFYLTPEDAFTVGDSFKHVFVMGASGSGKTSGSLATLFRSYLRVGYGGLVLCAKVEERDTWIRYAQQTGRVGDLVVVSPETGITFNFLNYELRRRSRGAGSVQNVVQMISTITDIVENKTQESIGEDFWDRAALQLVMLAVVVLSLCNEPLTLKNIQRFITSAPYGTETLSPVWQATSYCARRMEEAYQALKTPQEQRDLETALSYFLVELPRLGDRTRSSIEMTFSSVASKFLTGHISSILCTTTTIVPEVMWQAGKIVVLDLPVSEYGVEAIITQGVIKYTWQRAMLRRQRSEHPRPVFLAMDEYQNFMSSYDYRFISEARSAGVSVLMATQSISNLYSVLGSGARDQANSLLGNASTKIFHANTDVPTNEYASNVVGQEWQARQSRNIQQGLGQTGMNVSQQVTNRVLPSDFMALKTGGAANDYEVEGIIVQTGRGLWSSTKNVYHRAAFKQMFGG